MQESSWQESDSFSELQPISALLADLSGVPESNEEPEPNQSSTGNRRRRAAVALMAIWSGTFALHSFAWGAWFVLGLTTLMGVHVVRVLLARPLPLPKPLEDSNPEDLPFVSIMVAAKNEEAVIGRLVQTLCHLDYPDSRYELWIIDDSSSDRTPTVLAQLSQEYEQLRVFHRPLGAGGGKSGALNQVLPLTKGEIIAVFDADAQVTPDLLRRVLPIFERPEVGAVQVRKQIANVCSNLWIQGQVAEMALDAFWQQQRILMGGIGELRGNGQFVRRAALDQCGGWNEATITDDLDLTIRLHLNDWDIDSTTYPAVEEEGVTRAIALWHQRNRWAEGGYQRYLDYYQPLLQNRLGARKTIDMFVFWVLQYVLPSATIPDTLIAVLRHQPMLYAPLASLSVAMSLVGMTLGLRKIRRADPAIAAQTSLPTNALRFPLLSLMRAAYGTVYMLHWLPVVASTTARMSIRPKRLKWVKTVHFGANHEKSTNG
ncbi:MAG: glycosyltransferase family 2 protein [Oscillatoriales cyanobacterium C42_A2020_001]|nr:glycosyltransferase family 2 protein [Leptolyngbyaceae cyanobacterium C42_A2020_001]